MNRNPKFMMNVFFGAMIFLLIFLYDLITVPDLPAWPTAAIWYGVVVTITKLKTKKPLNVFMD